MPESLSLRTGSELCAQTVTCGGRSFTPDPDNAYIVFRLSHSLPAVTVFRCGLHPGTVAASWPTIVPKQFNFQHQRDRGIGTILAAEFPKMPDGGWKVPAKAADAPGIRAVAVIHRRAKGAQDMIDLHAEGEVQWEVSMEVDHDRNQGAFALPTEDGGWKFIPMGEAPDALRECLQNREGGGTLCVGEYEGVEPLFLWGGVPGLAGCAGKVRYMGTALCYAGAEPENHVDQIAASDDAKRAADVAAWMRAAGAALVRRTQL